MPAADGAVAPMEGAEAAPARAGIGVGTDAEQRSSAVSGTIGRVPRTLAVWGAFLAASAGAIVLLHAMGPDARFLPVRAAVTAPEAPAGSIASVAIAELPRIAPRAAAPARGTWRAIVVHDSGSPAGDVAALERRHSRAGLAGLGFHFVIGNGQGMDDGQVAAGYRWDHQLPGAHAVAGTSLAGLPAGTLDAAALNRSAIAICLVGNVDRRPPTDAQVAALVALVQSLQAEFGIDAEAVRFRSELGAAGGSAGAFPVSAFRGRLAR